MYIVNHFLDVDILGVLIPDIAKDSKTNAANGSGSIGEQADLCISTWGRTPNVILVDNFNEGRLCRPLWSSLLIFENRKRFCCSKYSESPLMN